ncbi:dienelactone hydrolase family protein [Massilia sp. TSP1-1-2]|uniref:dienelactone hydrolase family protein n=1 Tax=Massilia sp. TSP1-1-2 TaxID=2804649 RepID=UPI003CEE9C20
MNEHITIETPDGNFGAYVAHPAQVAGKAAPAIVVIQEIFGINADIRAHCDALAAHGYVAVAPDLFWRQESGIELTDASQEEWAKAFALYQGFDVDKGVADVAATMAVARTLPGVSGKVGVVGFCLGGLLTFLTATRCAPDAAVSYYGGRSNEFVGELAGMSTPLMMHLAGADQYIPKPAQDVIAAAAAALDNVQVFVYPGQDHAFARVNGQHFNADAAALAEQRTLAHFAALLV